MKTDLISSGSKITITPMEAAVARAMAFSLSLEGYHSWNGFIETFRTADDKEAKLLEQLYVAELSARDDEYN
jgi:hypothetical protein